MIPLNELFLFAGAALLTSEHRAWADANYRKFLGQSAHCALSRWHCVVVFPQPDMARSSALLHGLRPGRMGSSPRARTAKKCITGQSTGTLCHCPTLSLKVCLLTTRVKTQW